MSARIQALERVNWGRMVQNLHERVGPPKTMYAMQSIRLLWLAGLVELLGAQDRVGLCWLQAVCVRDGKEDPASAMLTVNHLHMGDRIFGRLGETNKDEAAQDAVLQIQQLGATQGLAKPWTHGRVDERVLADLPAAVVRLLEQCVEQELSLCQAEAMEQSVPGAKGSTRARRLRL